MVSFSTVVIDIYDSGILISNGEKVLIDSPSCAIIDTDYSIIIGDSALQQVHLRPYESSTTYWTNLSTNSDTKNIVSNAEIAYKHLALAWEQADLQNTNAILIVPNTFNKQDLGLLLGICKKISIPIFALMSNTVLALRNSVQNCKTIYLDILQQKIVLNEIDHDDKTVSARQVTKTLPYGLEKLAANLAKTVAKKFVHETRFDPMHSAEDEQRFYNALPQWLTLLNHTDTVECNLESNTSHYKITITKNDIAPVNQLAFNEIALSLSALLPNDDCNMFIICSPYCNKVFSLIEFLSSLPGCAVTLLEKTSLAKQALSLKDYIPTKEEQVHYTTSLNWQDYVSRADIKFNDKSLKHLDSIPTHILFKHVAYSLADDTFINKINKTSELSVSNKSSDDVACKVSSNGYLKEISKLNTANILLNNVTVATSCFVSIGDVLSITNVEEEFRFIKVNTYET